MKNNWGNRGKVLLYFIKEMKIKKKSIIYKRSSFLPRLHRLFSYGVQQMKKIKAKDRIQVFVRNSDAEYIGTLISFTKYGVSMDSCFDQRWSPIFIPYQEIKLVKKVVR